jgi:hypothetical protein
MKKQTSTEKGNRFDRIFKENLQDLFPQVLSFLTKHDYSSAQPLPTKLPKK